MEQDLGIPSTVKGVRLVDGSQMIELLKCLEQNLAAFL
jgi:hypothetical protein